MRIGLRLLLGFFAVLGLALFVVLRVFVEEVKPGTRLAMEDALVDTAHSLAPLAAADMKAGTIASGGFAAASRRHSAVCASCACRPICRASARRAWTCA